MLKINMEYRRGILFIRLKGNLNKNTVSRFEEYTLPIIEHYGIRYVVYNLNKLDNLDNFGYNSIIKSKNIIVKNKGKVLLVNKNSLSNITSELVALELLTT
jgi:anti-anti-sigma factor